MTVRADFDDRAFAQAVKMRRQQYKWSRERLALEIGRDESVIVSIENMYYLPNLNILMSLCEALALDVSAFWKLTKE